MKVDISGTIAHLTGNWTRTEMTDSNIDLLAVSLSQLRAAGVKNLQIDCKELNEVDGSGLQLLYIWLCSFRFRGVELELINLPEKLRKTLQSLVFKICCSGKSLDMARPHFTTTNH